MKYLFTIWLAIFCLACQAPQQKKRQGLATNNVLYKEVLAMDQLLFSQGFENGDTVVLENLLSEDFEFFHDEHGPMLSKESFMQSVQQLQGLPYKTLRTLEIASMEVFPMYKNGGEELYGLLQQGEHLFFHQNQGEEARQSGKANFSHLWIKEGEQWKLKRVFSFNH